MSARHAKWILSCAFVALAIAPAKAQPAPQASQPASDRSLAAANTFVLRDVRFVGNNVFSSERLRAEIQSYIGRRITTDELEDARVKLTRLYVDSNYITSGVILPDQEIDPNDAV